MGPSTLLRRAARRLQDGCGAFDGDFFEAGVGGRGREKEEKVKKKKNEKEKDSDGDGGEGEREKEEESEKEGQGMACFPCCFTWKAGARLGSGPCLRLCNIGCLNRYRNRLLLPAAVEGYRLKQAVL